MVHLNANDIDTDQALVYEATTALTMQAILKVFSLFSTSSNSITEVSSVHLNFVGGAGL